MILSPEQEQELERFQEEKLRIRKELRDVRLGLDQDIKSLGNRLKLINIVLVPLGFVIVAVFFALWRRSKRAEYTSPAATSQQPASAAEPQKDASA